MSPPLRPRHHLVAGLALLAHVVFFLTATPGVDAWGSKTLRSAEDRAEVARDWGPAAAEIAGAIADLNRKWRIPLVQRFNPIERLFRIKQSWHLYGSAPRQVRRLEIHVDDRLVFRSRDREHDWRAEQLENRRVRPTVKTLATKPDGYNWKGLGRFIVDGVRQDFPDARLVRITGTVTAGAGTRVSHGREARAPDWALQPIAPAAAGELP